MDITITLNGESYTGACQPGTTLSEFFRAINVSPPPEVLRTEDGRMVASEYTLARFCSGAHLQEVAVGQPAPALTASELLTSKL